MGLIPVGDVLDLMIHVGPFQARIFWESQQHTGCTAEHDLNEAWEPLSQNVLEVEQLHKIVQEKKSQWEEAEHQNKELQVCLQSLEGERSLWEEMEQSLLQSFVRKTCENVTCSWP